jgi:hypothetical protein
MTDDLEPKRQESRLSVIRRIMPYVVALMAVGMAGELPAEDGGLAVDIKQITSGPKTHFFGYIGHVRTIPWNQSERYIVALQTGFQDHMPAANEAADIILMDTQRSYAITVVDKTRAWNPQQGTMLYWNPESPETQFFFNDRDPETNHVFCVLFDISQGKRVQEYRFSDTPVGNSGVAQNGGLFLGLNCGRLARLRPVTGYPEAYDWTKDVNNPDDDGIFRINITTKETKLIVSYRQLADALRSLYPDIDRKAIFINHTLWNRKDDRIYFFARSRGGGSGRVDVPFTVNPDGSELTKQTLYVRGHPEWDAGYGIFGGKDGNQVVYDTTKQAITEVLGNPAIFPKPDGDIALSPDAAWLVSGYRVGQQNFYVFYRHSDRAHIGTPGFDVDHWTSGDLRLDPAPLWNRSGTAILVPGIAHDAERTRQLFIVRLAKAGVEGNP